MRPFSVSGFDGRWTPFGHARIRREVNGKAFTGYVEDIEQGKVTHESCSVAWELR